MRLVGQGAHYNTSREDSTEGASVRLCINTLLFYLFADSI